MKVLDEIIFKTFINIHRNEKKDWISLEEIYDTLVEKEKIKRTKDEIKKSMDEHTLTSELFKGEQYYISNNNLYQNICYEQIKFINNINIGDIFTRDQLMAIFKISGQSGMMKTNILNCLVLTTSENNGIYNDSKVSDGTFIYTGEGQIGNQELNKNNKTLYESRETKLPVYLFSKDKKRKYIFEGRVELYDDPYRAPEKDINGDERLVWKFPLKVLYSNEQNEFEKIDLKKISYQINEIENKIEVENIDKELILKEGLIEIRKYRKTGKHVHRTSKPDFIAQEIIKNKQGIINEKVVFETELKRLMDEEADEQVKLMEDFFNNKKENEGFDILSFEKTATGEYTEKYIEVKSTKGSESTPIDITVDEIEFAKAHINNYYLYRIINSDSNKRYLKIINGTEMFENYDFIPVAFKIFSK